MERIACVVAALGAVAIVTPTMVNAETMVIKRGENHHFYGARAEFREHRGWHEGWRHRHADKVVIVKHRHRYD